jgi:hypothetical protein
VAGSCIYGDEPSGFGATELVSYGMIVMERHTILFVLTSFLKCVTTIWRTYYELVRRYMQTLKLCTSIVFDNLATVVKAIRFRN